jgi:hypothetical protein
VQQRLPVRHLGADARSLDIVVRNALDLGEILLVAVAQQAAFLQHIHRFAYAFHGLDLLQWKAVQGDGLAKGGRDAHGRFRNIVERDDQPFKPVEHRQHDDHGCCDHRHTAHRYGRDDVDGVVRLLAEEVTLGDMKGKVQDRLADQLI